MALVSVDPRDMCPGCRVCFVPDNPCLVCDALTSDQRAQSIQARRRRLRREERKRIARAGSIGSVSASGSSQCGPQERKGSGHPGSSLTYSVAGQGAGMPSPRSSRAESSSRAGNDGDNGGVTSRRPRSPDGGRDTSRDPGPRMVVVTLAPSAPPIEGRRLNGGISHTLPGVTVTAFPLSLLTRVTLPVRLLTGCPGTGPEGDRFAIVTNDGLRVFQFRALPFGLTSAPRIFTKVILPLGHHAHLHAVCLLQYLDDWLLRSPNKSLLARQTSWLLEIIRRVGFVLNEPKSQLVPTQRLIHIGVEYHLDLGLIFPPMTRVQKFEGKISILLSVSVTTAYFWLSLLGLLSSATDAIPLGRLHLRPLQLYLLAHWAPASKDLKALVPVKHDLLDHHLRWWLDRTCTRAGMLMDIPEAQARLFTDASQSGWGAHLDTDQVSGSWSTREATLHINHLEMLAVLYALRAFRVQLTGLTVQLMSDNASVVAYIRKQGGTVSVPLYRLTREVLILARDAHITLLAKHIPGERNALADLLSRMDKIVHTEWTLLHSVFEALCMTWDKPNLDLFATRLNNILPVFVSPMADPLALDVDAMSMSWRGMYAYAFPPFVMLGRVLEKVLKDHPCEMILVAPKWPNQCWYARLLELLVELPLVLPLREDLLFQPHNHQRHRSLPAVCLHAWRLSSDLSKREAFRRQLPIRSLAVVDNLHGLSTTASGRSSLVGVLGNRWIRSELLFHS